MKYPRSQKGEEQEGILKNGNEIFLYERTEVEIVDDIETITRSKRTSEPHGKISSPFFSTPC